MKLCSVMDEQAILCDTPLCWCEVHRLEAGAVIGARSSAPVEVILCAVAGELQVTVGDEQLFCAAMEGVQIPAGQSWRAQAGATGVQLLRVDSFYPQFTPERSLMPPLTQPQRFSVGDGEMLVCTDYVRGGVLNFKPGYAADKHYHQDADEIFWFFQGVCRVETPDQVVLAPAGSIVYTAAGEWHIIESVGDEPLLMFLTVTPNIVPSHTFFDANGNPVVRSWAPIRKLYPTGVPREEPTH
jgi:quercetin dioxygenase-like cupin family protein